MKTKLLFTICLLAFVFTGFSKESVSWAEIYIKRVKQGKLIAFQQTNNNGLVSFSKLAKGTYNLVVDIPKQKGKFAIGRGKANSHLKVGYHFDKKLYFLQDSQGYFVSSFSGIKNITNSNISPMYEVEKGNNNSRIILVSLV